MIVKRRKIISGVSSVVVPENTISVAVTYSSLPANTNFSFEDLKYGKTAGFIFEKDDGGATDQSIVMGYLNGGFPAIDGTTYPGVYYTDGCGNPVKFKYNFALTAGSIAGNTDRYTEALSKGDGIMNHSYYHEPAYNAYKALKDVEKLVWDNWNYRVRTMVIPTDYGGYLATAIRYLGYKFVGSAFATNTLDGYDSEIKWGTKANVVGLNENYTLLSREVFDSDWNTNLTSQKTLVDSTLAASTGGAKYIGQGFSHGPYDDGSVNDMNDFKAFVSYVINHPSNNDRVWIPSAQEFAEYMEIKKYYTDNPGKVVKSISGNTVTYTFDTSTLPSENQLRDFTIKVGTGITGIVVTGADNHSYNTTTGLINVFKKNTSVRSPYADSLPPQIIRANGTGSVINITYDKSVTQTLAGFAVTGNTVTSLTGSGTTWQLNLQNTWAFGQDLTYRIEAGNAYETGNLSNKVCSFIGFPVNNPLADANTSDSTVPLLFDYYLWTNNQGVYNNKGSADFQQIFAAQYIPAGMEARIWMKNQTSGGAYLGLATSLTNNENTGLQGIITGVGFEGGNVKRIENGVDGYISGAGSTYYGLLRMANGTMKVQSSSDGTTWADVLTLTTTNASKLYIVGALRGREFNGPITLPFVTIISGGTISDLYEPTTTFNLFALAAPTATGTQQSGILPFQKSQLWQRQSPSYDITKMFTNTDPTGPALEFFGQLYPEYDAYIDYPVAMQATISGFHFALPYGDYSDRQLKVYGTPIGGGSEVLMWTMTGVLTGQYIDQYQSVTPMLVKRLRLHIINNSYPIYFRPEGIYYNTIAATKPALNYYPLKNQFGINTQYWSWESNGNAYFIDNARLERNKDFKGWNRLYVERDKTEPVKNGYRWNTTNDGGWSVDEIVKNAYLQGINVYLCPTSVQRWIKFTYSADVNPKDTWELPPVIYGESKLLPYSYRHDRDFFVEATMRYGRNANVPDSDIHVDSTPAYNGGPFTAKLKGTGWVKALELDNERDKWWKDEVAHQTGAEMAAYASMVFDGHKGAFGIGVKDIDPTMLLMFGGLADWSKDYFTDFKEWVVANRGYKGSGVVDWPIDILAYHNYWGSAGQYQGSSGGSCVEKAVPNVIDRMDEWNDFVQREFNGMPYICNEIGWDKNAGTGFSAPTIGSKTPEIVVADWQTRYNLIAAAKGQLATSAYLHQDDTSRPNDVFASMGWVKQDLSRYAVLNYAVQVQALMGESKYVDNLSFGASDKYILRFQDTAHSYYVCWMGSMTNATGTYNIPFPAGTSITLYTLNTGSTTPTTQNITTTGTFYTVAVSETPVFIKVN